MTHTPGHTILPCAVPSAGAGYFLSGRAAVDALDAPHRLDAHGAADELAVLRARVAAAGLSHRQIMVALGYRTRDAVNGRLHGRYKWQRDDLAALHRLLAEAGR